jgi:hypothetical protein
MRSPVTIQQASDIGARQREGKVNQARYDGSMARVRFTGTIDGLEQFTADNSAMTGTYTVTIDRTNDVVTCSCKSGQVNVPCKHMRGAVHSL